jgi:hypothetical protein
MSFHTPDLKERILTISPYILIVLLTLFIWFTLASPTVQDTDFLIASNALTPIVSIG